MMARGRVEMRVGALLVAAVVGTGCAPQASRGEVASALPSVTPTSTRSIRPPAGPVELPRLPDQGFVVGSRGRVVFVGLDGSELHEVSRFEVAGNPGASGVWLGRGREYFRLEVGRHRLVPLDRRRARAHMYEEGSAPELPTPAEQVVHCRTCPPEGMPVGYWRYALPSPDGSVLLAQYSGECEIPTAYWFEDGGEPQEITGARSVAAAPESKVLGWTADGRALVYLGEGYCGSSGDPPGIYAFRGPGDGELVYRTPPRAVVEMWGPE